MNIPALRVQTCRGSRSPYCLQAFTRAELLATIGALALLAIIVLPAVGSTRPHARLAECANNLRQIARGFHLWAAEHGWQQPFLLSPAQGGTKQHARAGKHFVVLSNILSTPAILRCPSDGARARAGDWSSFQSQPEIYLSYFVGLHATYDVPQSVLGGDRNVIPDATTSCSFAEAAAAAIYATNSNAKWSITIHVERGNLLLTDGSVVTRSSATRPQPFAGPNHGSPAATHLILP